jgi:nicotinamide-nucleotide amidase
VNHAQAESDLKGITMDLHQNLSQTVGHMLLQQQRVLTTAESCTGGGLASAITEIAGSSQWFDRAFITYSNAAKVEMLAVKPQTLDQFGAVSEATVIEMAQGALSHSNASIAVSISGIAGPSGGSEEKPVGTVCLAWQSTCGWRKVETHYFSGDRAQVRQQAVHQALVTLHDYLISEEN